MEQKPKKQAKGIEHMFLGEYQHTLDNKGRIIIPARFREELGSSFVATKGLDNCIFLYTNEEWHLIEKKIHALPFTRQDVRAFSRFFFSGASEIEIDKQGRINIPPNLRSYAGIEKESVIIGVGARIEIWALENWEQYQSSAADSFEELAEKLVDLGI